MQYSAKIIPLTRKHASLTVSDNLNFFKRAGIKLVKRILVLDGGTNSFKFVTYKVKYDGKDIILIPSIKDGEQVGMGRDARHGMEFAKKNVFNKIIGMRDEFDPDAEAIIVTHWFREILGKGNQAQIEEVTDFLQELADTLGISLSKHLTAATEKLEAELTGEAAALADFKNGIVLMVGGGSCQIVHMVHGKIANWAVLPLGSNNLYGREDVEALFKQKLDEIPWLRDAMKHSKDLLILGGALRVVGRQAKETMHRHNKRWAHMPYRGWNFKWEKDSKFRNFTEKLSEQTRESLFEKRFGISRKKAEAWMEKHPHIELLDTEGKLTWYECDEARAKIAKWDKKDGARADALPYVLPLLRVMADRQHKLAKRPIDVRISPASIRDAAAARMVNATKLQY